MDTAQITLIVGAVGSVLAFLGTIAGMILATYKENRTRRWQVEDREELARTTRHGLKNTEQSVKSQFDETKDKLDQIIRDAEKRLELLRGDIKENTEVSKEAFKEANDVNGKLHAMGYELINAKPKEVLVVNQEPIPVHDASTK